MSRSSLRAVIPNIADAGLPVAPQKSTAADGHRPRLRQLDGLRSLAVLSVFLVHGGLFPSGWIGVDIFFVLSGFLITGILRQIRTSDSYWRSFYARRVTRILPPVVLLIVLVSLYYRELKAGSFGYLLFAGNILQFTPYAIVLLSPLWSLAVEEHFYLVWPLAVRSLTRKQLFVLALCLIGMSPIVRALATVLFHHIYGPHLGWDTPTFLLTPFRLDGLAAGAALALLLEDAPDEESLRARFARTFLQKWSGPLAVVAACAFFGGEGLWRWFRRSSDTVSFNSIGFSMVTALSFFIVSYLVTNPSRIPAKLLASKIPVFLGSVSYGLYLFQVPVGYELDRLFGASLSGRPWLMVIADFSMTLVVAVLSFYCLERPAMAYGRRLATARNLAQAGL